MQGELAVARQVDAVTEVQSSVQYRQGFIFRHIDFV